MTSVAVRYNVRKHRFEDSLLGHDARTAKIFCPSKRVTRLVDLHLLPSRTPGFKCGREVAIRCLAEIDEKQIDELGKEKTEDRKAGHA
ncbi:hypothetical protein lerEdw1_014032 [Lerista edwardsae]|nr:hypothetical protein lerEdw1_014033 [Lerista edwardsae]KAJ6634424.1 hypothetical protein lerEdw1_014032 [Lerista edwardsae]